MSRGEKAHYVQLGTRIPPTDYQALKSYYQAHGMLSKVIRVLINRHLQKLRARDERVAAGIGLTLDPEVVSVRELEDAS